MEKRTLPNVRIENDVRLYVSLKDNGVRVDWNSLGGIFAGLYSDTQKIMAGPAVAQVDPEDGEVLIVRYSARSPQYLGPQRLVIRGEYQGQKKTYDTPAFVFVAKTADMEGEPLEISDPEVAVELEVREVSTSLLDEAIAACIAATVNALEAAAKADAAAGHAPLIHEGYWFIWNAETGEYEGTGVPARGYDGAPGKDGQDGKDGAKGDKGESGDLNYPTFEIDSNMHLKVSALTEGSAERFSIQNGHLKMTL